MQKRSPTSFFFHPDAVESEGKDLVGRRSAGQSFLHAYLSHNTNDSITAVVDSPKAGKTLRAVMDGMGDNRPLALATPRTKVQLEAVGTVFFPTPGYQDFQWNRHRHGAAACSFVGITHTVSTKRIMKSLHAMLADPIAAHDAIICTSHAVKSVVARQFEAEVEYYAERFGQTRLTLPQLPVIPLGVHAEDFAPMDGARGRVRADQEVPEDAIVVMTMGRISSVEKANPVPMFLALEQVAQSTGRELHLWMTGWTHLDQEIALHHEAAAALCPSVAFRLHDGRDPDLRRNLWAGADIFTLPADSIQETFGLVPVEAMAAGLPVVMPDWDGFRDTVVHGETGFLVPTRMAAPGTSPAYAARFVDGRDGYLQYLTLVQTQVQIDVPAYAAAFETLVRDPQLRRQMGAAARAHVMATLDWSAVMPQYQALADNLAEQRQSAQGLKPGKIPFEIDPFTLYAGYPSAAITPEDVITLNGIPTADTHRQMDAFCGRSLHKRFITDPDKLDAFCGWLATHGPLSVRDIAHGLDLPLTHTASLVLMLAKCDLVRLASPPLRNKS